ncbi:hypothetical protein UFOVP681_52 [uncultured Caudovirales phage]|uniref:Uncharacterized protein n=1 Tax=uncultured Caudovirales phage TaxID=2100421 RepID=A0A6J5NDV4_9CAUD|nr:hypothetical protein UFOVP681_52 [uncultured Caudovirales phage]
MTDDALKQALAELGDVVRCRCDEAYRERDLQDPECNCDSMDAVRVVIARIEWLERERVLDAKLLADTQALLDTALEAVIDAKLVAEAKLAEVEKERDAADRDAGAAERKMADMQDSQIKRNDWLWRAKKERGYDQNISFDKVWAETCAKADSAEAAEAKVQALEAERDAAIAALEESGRKRGETLALLDKAVVALRRIADAADRKHVGDIARAVLAEIGGNA